MTDIFKALSEESRLRILSLLLENEMCVCEIEDSLHLTQSNASRHLTALRKCGILESYKQAQWAYYRISDDFKQEHSGLWAYLHNKLQEIPTFQTDYDEFINCRKKDRCKSNE